ncbi:unnamed protein product [Boreogadus saida]
MRCQSASNCPLAPPQTPLWLRPGHPSGSAPDTPLAPPQTPISPRPFCKCQPVMQECRTLRSMAADTPAPRRHLAVTF